jgi:ribonuclease PH
LGDQEAIRIDGRAADELRPVKIHPHYLKNAEGSVLIEMGGTKVICAVTLEHRAPAHAREANTGWLTAEYAMLPRATTERTMRDGVRGKLGGRSHEIQRMIGRALRAVVNLDKLVDRTLIVDCDVIEADGGTRTAALTGAWVALALTLERLQLEGKVTKEILTDSLAAVSVGIVEGRPALDLCYLEDAQADVDMNVVMTGSGRYIELQGTAESEPFDADQLEQLLALARKGIGELTTCQQQILDACRGNA